jgi:Domain of unknown function (DUF4160)
MHVHVHAADGEAKFWLEPKIALAQNHGLSDRQITIVHKLIDEYADEIRKAWKTHFGG